MMSLTQSERHTVMYEQEKRQRHQNRCNHKRRTFRLGDDVLGVPAIIVCDSCGFHLTGEVAKDARDAGVATTVETRKALPAP